MNFAVQPMTLQVEEQPAAVSFRAMWGAVLRRWRLVAAVFAIVAALVFLFIVVQPARYTADATIMIRPGLDRMVTDLQPESGAAQQAASLSSAIDSEVEILRSPELARRVVTRLQLAEDPEWNGALLRVGFLTAVRPATAQSRADEAVTRLLQAVRVRRRAVSEVVDIEVNAASAQRAAEIANVYVDTYLAMSVEAQNERTARATAWLDQRLQALQEDVHAKERAVAEFRAQSGLFVGTGETLSEQQVRALQDSIVAARADLAERSARYSQLRTLVDNGGSPDSIASALTSDVIRDLRREEAVLSRTQAELESRLQERHPDVVNGRQQIADVRLQIQAEMRRIAANAEGEVGVAQARLRTLQGALGSAGGAQSSDAEVRLAQLTREAAASRSVYEIFLQRYHQMIGQGEIAPLQVRLVSSAVAPFAPSWPDRRIALLVAIAIGAMAAGLVLLAVERLTDPVASADELERRIGVATLGAVPQVSSGALRLLPPGARHPAGYLTGNRFSAYAEAFRGLRTSLRFASGGAPVQVLAVTSAHQHEGKTTCALSLARASALAGQKVILIDCDSRRRTLNDVLGVEPAAGLWHVLAGETDWRSVTGADETTPAHILPSAPGEFATADMLASDSFDALLDELRSHYDLIVLDCPPVWAVADTRLLAAKGDGVVLVTRWNKTSVRALSAAVRHLAPSGARLLGVVVNGIDGEAARWAGYGEYDTTGYAAA